MMQPPIALTGLVLKTPLLEETATFYVEQFGLTVDQRSDDAVALTASAAATPPVTLQRAREPGLGGLSFAMRDRAAIEDAFRTLTALKLDPLQASSESIRVCDPDGTQVTLHVGEDVSVGELPTPTDRPMFMSHVVLNSQDPERLLVFYRDVLGLRVSDRYEKGLLVFLRCDQPQHHCLGISPGANNGLNHFAMDCGNVDAVMRGMSRLHRTGGQQVWGPGRHGPGGNVFCYFEDPTGFVPEFTCEVLQISEDASWKPREWLRTPENGNVWLTGGPSERAAALMSGSGFPNAAARPAVAPIE